MPARPSPEVEPSPLADAIAEAVAQCQAGATLLYSLGDDRVVQQGGQLQHWRGEALLVSQPKRQGWRRILGALVGMAMQAPAAPAPLPKPARHTRRVPAGIRRPLASPPSPPPATLPPDGSTSATQEGDVPQLYTDGGYVLGEVISALQKDIRRGNEAQALSWALELVPKYEAYLWRRLNVIAQEDIGIANAPLLALVPSQEAQWFRFRAVGKDGTCRLILANTILAMCRSPKSRLADHFQCVVNQRRLHGARLEVPDYALDKHTGRGKRLGRGVDHWRAEGCVLHPDAELDDPYAEEAYDWWARPDFVQTAWGKKTAKGSAPQEEQQELF
jgi:hypothetical protein